MFERIPSTCFKYVINLSILLFLVHDVVSVIEADVSMGSGDRTASLRLTRQKVLIRAIPKSEKFTESRKRHLIYSHDEYSPPDIVVEQFRIRAKINFQARPRMCKHLLGNRSNPKKFQTITSSTQDRSVVNCDEKLTLPSFNETVVGVQSWIESGSTSNDPAITTDPPSFSLKTTTDLLNRNIIFDGNKEFMEKALTRRQDIVRTERKKMDWPSPSLSIPYDLTEKISQSSSIEANEKFRFDDIRSKDRIKKQPEITYKKFLPFLYRYKIADKQNNEIEKTESLLIDNNLNEKVHNRYRRDAPIVQPWQRELMKNNVKNNSGELLINKKANVVIVGTDNNESINVKLENDIFMTDNLTDNDESHRADKRLLNDPDSDGIEKKLMKQLDSSSSKKKKNKVIRTIRNSTKLNSELDKRFKDALKHKMLSPVFDIYSKFIQSLTKQSLKISCTKQKKPLQSSKEDGTKIAPPIINEKNLVTNHCDPRDSLKNSDTDILQTAMVGPIYPASVVDPIVKNAPNNSDIYRWESIKKISLNDIYKNSTGRGNRIIAPLSKSRRIVNETHEYRTNGDEKKKKENCTDVVINSLHNCSANESFETWTSPTMVKRYSRNDTFYENANSRDKIIVDVITKKDTKYDEIKNSFDNGLRKFHIGRLNIGKNRVRYKGKMQQHPVVGALVRPIPSFSPSIPLSLLPTVMNGSSNFSGQNRTDASLLLSFPTAAAATASSDIESFKISTYSSIVESEKTNDHTEQVTVNELSTINGTSQSSTMTFRHPSVLSNSVSYSENKSIESSTISYDASIIERIPAEYRDKIVIAATESMKSNGVTESSTVTGDTSTVLYEQSTVRYVPIINESFANNVNEVVSDASLTRSTDKQLFVNLTESIRFNHSMDSSDDKVKKVHYVRMENNHAKNKKKTVSLDWESRENSTSVESVNGASTTSASAMESNSIGRLKTVRKLREIGRLPEYEEAELDYEIDNGGGGAIVAGPLPTQEQRTDEGFGTSVSKNNIRFAGNLPHTAVHGVFFKANRPSQQSKSIHQTRNDFVPVSIDAENSNGIIDNLTNSIDETGLVAFVKSLEQFIFDDSATGTFVRKHLLLRDRDLVGESSNGNFQTRSAIFKTKRLIVVDKNNIVNKTAVTTNSVVKSIATKKSFDASLSRTRIRANNTGDGNRSVRKI